MKLLEYNSIESREDEQLIISNFGIILPLLLELWDTHSRKLFAFSIRNIGNKTLANSSDIFFLPHLPREGKKKEEKINVLFTLRTKKEKN